MKRISAAALLLALAACSSTSSGTETPAEAVTPEECEILRKTYATAADAFYALEGVDPTSLSVLVDEGLIEGEPMYFELVDLEVRPIADGPCG